MQMQSTYWLENELKMISLYVNALLCTLHVTQLNGINSQNFSPNNFLQVFHENPARL